MLDSALDLVVVGYRQGETAGVSVAWCSGRRKRLYAEIVTGLEVRATKAVERRVTGDKEFQAKVGAKLKDRG